jgi:spermidine/putrescine transport system ATP-binding protein
MRGDSPLFPVNNPLPSAVEVISIVRRFGTVSALAGVSLAIRPGEFFSLLGPSGCGKTTLLRLIAGLDLPDSGTIKIDGADAADIPAHRRPVNTVFQSYALFPHLTVSENIAFGLRMKKIPTSEIAGRVARALALVQITELAGRKPAQLSGGQKQRVALARALVNEPKVLLLDEPLGALDLQLRRQLQVELHQLQRQLGITFIMVTHDQEEALVMSDRIAVMNAGNIEQLGSAREIYERPRTRFVAQFIGQCNVLAAEVRPTNNCHVVARTALGEFSVANAPAGGVKPGGFVAIRPEKIQLRAGPGKGAGNSFTARVEDFTYCGAETQYRLRAGQQPLNAVVMNREAAAVFQNGDTVQCELPPEHLILLDE